MPTTANEKFIFIKKDMIVRNYYLLILAVLFLASCAGSPARMMQQSDSEIRRDLLSYTNQELCRRYMKGVFAFMDDPSSKYTGVTYYRVNPQIESILKQRKLNKNYCYDQNAVDVYKEKLEQERRKKSDEVRIRCSSYNNVTTCRSS